MDASTDLASHAHAAHDPHHHDDGHDHHELGWWRKYVFSTDHKVIGIQYAITGLIFLFFGFTLMMLMRWQLAFPGRAVPVLGDLLANVFGAEMPDGKMTPDFYNSFGAMHGTIMIFLGIVPVAFAAFGNFVVPLQIGAPDMTFPKINMASYWAFFVGGVIMLVSFFVPGGAAKGGWTSYTPLSVIADTGPGHHWFWNGQTSLADRLHFPHHFVAARRGQFHHHHHSVAGQGADLDAAAVFRLGAVHHRFSSPPGVSSAGGGGRHATDGSARRDQLFHADGIGREWRGHADQRRRQPAALAASLLVPRASRGLRADSARHGHRRGDHRQQHAQAALGLQVAGLRGASCSVSSPSSSGRTTCG